MFHPDRSAIAVEAQRRNVATVNEPVLGFEKGSKERQLVKEALAEVESHTRLVPIVIGDEEVFTDTVQYQCSVSSSSTFRHF